MALSVEKKVGLFFLATLVALGILIEVVEDWNPFQTQVSYHTFFESAVGLKVGDPVRVAGVDVGKVKQIRLEERKARVDFYVIEGAPVTAASVARISSTNLLGGQFLGIGSNGAAPLLPEGSAIPSEEGSSIDELITSFDRNQDRVMRDISNLVEELRGPLVGTVEKFDAVAAKINQGEGTLGRLVNDPALYRDLSAAVGGLKTVLVRLEKGEGSLGKLLQDPALYEEARLTVASLREIMDRIREGEGTLGRLVNDDALYNNLNNSFGQFGEIVTKANAGQGTLGRLVNDDALYVEFHGALARINSIAAKIDDGKGTFGRLVNEDDLYRDAKTTLHKVEKTVDGMSDSGPLSALGVVLGTLF